LLAIALLTGRRYELRMEWRNTLNILLRPPAVEPPARDGIRDDVSGMTSGTPPRAPTTH
jgi:hypothetical protein